MTKKNETPKKYLYGASVQGIQGFIFQTNKLREIVGASEIVEQICTDAFDEYAVNGESIVRAAGNIKYLFSSEAACIEAVRNFPRKIMNMAPGITISQAVVVVETDDDYASKANELEKNLIVQRNKQTRPMNLGLMGVQRSPATGFPAVDIDKKGKLMDEASTCKIEKHNTLKKLINKSFGEKISDTRIAYEIDDIAGKNHWIAIIHADGNGIGNIVRVLGETKEDMIKFSGLLDNIAQKAANAAYKATKGDSGSNGIIPLRPVVLSGDDMTLICRADLAVEYTRCFLEVFEKESREQFGKIILKKGENQYLLNNGLTACAGIAFVKSSYPFHYGVHLAESLCSRAKKAAKKIDEDLAPSCLMFHKMQDSFVENFEKIAERELIPLGTKLNFEAGPYYCGSRAKEKYKETCQQTIDKLLNDITSMEKISVRSHLRNWLSMLFDSIGSANQTMRRLRMVNRDARQLIGAEYEVLTEDSEKIIPFYDILSLDSVLKSDTENK